MKVDAPSGPSLEAMAADPSKIDGARVAREFEALLMAQVWKGAMKPSGTSKLLDSGSAGQMYREFFIDEVVRRVASSQGMGLADDIEAGMRARAETGPRAEPKGKTDE